MIVDLIKPLEGMRALAVLAVLLFHLDIALFQGGYIGVDIFFVISGYIITKNILSQLDNNWFSFAQFYYKRFRRLFPALIATVLLTLIAAFFILPPSNFSDLGESGVWSLFSLANVHFWLQAGYFDVDADRKALLHMWSLGVEEQFYLFWPLLLAICRPKSIKLVSIVLLGAASLIGGILLYNAFPSAIFYLFPFRIYQFMAGAFLALIPLQIQRGGSILSLLGVAGLLAGCVILAAEDYTTIESGAVATLTGFILLISSKSTFAQIALGNRVMLWIGSRSYVIYLVHWPIIVLYKYATDFQLSPNEVAALFVASIVVGELLARCVEIPFRIRSNQPNPTRLPANTLAVSTLAISVFAASNIWGSEGYPGRISDDMQSLITQNADIEETRLAAIRNTICHARRNYQKTYLPDECITLEPRKTNILVLGDSLAADVWMMLDRGLPASFEVSQATQAACRPIHPDHDRPDNPQCEAFNAIRFNEYVAKKWDAIVIAGQWRQQEADGLGPTLEYLSEHSPHVFVFGPRPRFQSIPIEVLERATSLDQLTQTLNQNVQLYAPLNDAMKKISMANGVTYFDMTDIQCPNESCALVDSGNLLYRDRDHLSVAGADTFGKSVLPTIESMLKK